MMKKLNYVLILITWVLSIIAVIMKLDDGLVVSLKNLSIIILVCLPYILNKLFKCKLSDGFAFIWIIFIFMAQYLGVIERFYSIFPGYDKVTHTISGVLSGYVGYMLIKNKKLNPLFVVLFILSFTWLCAGLWETFEFTCDNLFGGDAQQVKATGVADTMWDMIVAFIGSLFVAGTYYIKSNK